MKKFGNGDEASKSNGVFAGENGTRCTKNKLWTNKVDGVARKTTKQELEDCEVIQPAESNVKAFFSNLLRFSLKRLYNGEESAGIAEGEDGEEDSDDDGSVSESMGNLQSGDGKRVFSGKSPARDKKKGFLLKKSQGKVRQQQSEEVPAAEKAVPPEGVAGAEEPTVTRANGNAVSVEPEPAERSDASMVSDAKFFAEDFWRDVAKAEAGLQVASGSRESSEESIFTDPLSPRAFEGPEEGGPAESDSSKITTSTLSPGGAHQTELDESTSLDDVTLIDEQITEMDEDSTCNSFSQQERGKSTSFDLLEETSSASLSRPTSFTLHKHKKVELGPITSEYPPFSSSVFVCRRYVATIDRARRKQVTHERRPFPVADHSSDHWYLLTITFTSSLQLVSLLQYVRTYFVFNDFLP